MDTTLIHSYTKLDAALTIHDAWAIGTMDQYNDTADRFAVRNDCDFVTYDSTIRVQAKGQQTTFFTSFPADAARPTPNQATPIFGFCRWPANLAVRGARRIAPSRRSRWMGW